MADSSIIDRRTAYKLQNVYNLSKKLEFHERQEKRETYNPDIEEGFFFIDQKTSKNLPLISWPDKTGDQKAEQRRQYQNTFKARTRVSGIIIKMKYRKEGLSCENTLHSSWKQISGDCARTRQL